MRKLILVIFFSTFLSYVQAKKDEQVEFSSDLMFGEMEVAKLFESLQYATLYGLPDSSRITIGDAIFKKMGEIIRSDKNTFFYPFENLFRLGKIYSDDNNLRIYSWNIELSDYSQRYYSILQTQQAAYPLRQGTQGTYFPPQREKIPFNNWYGTLYYKAICIEEGEQYILLGIGRLNTRESFRVIDVLSFDDKKASLGAPIFRLDNGDNMRMAFRYCANMRMSIDYNRKRKEFIFDHLAPTGESAGVCLGPDMSFDAIRRKGSRYILRKDVDVRNRR